MALVKFHKTMAAKKIALSLRRANRFGRRHQAFTTRDDAAHPAPLILSLAFSLCQQFPSSVV